MWRKISVFGFVIWREEKTILGGIGGDWSLTTHQEESFPRQEFLQLSNPLSSSIILLRSMTTNAEKQMGLVSSAGKYQAAIFTTQEAKFWELIFLRKYFLVCLTKRKAHCTPFCQILGTLSQTVCGIQSFGAITLFMWTSSFPFLKEDNWKEALTTLCLCLV